MMKEVGGEGREGGEEGVRNLLAVAISATWRTIDCILQLLLVCGGGSRVNK